MLKLGSLKIKYPFFQASLSGYSDYAMREIARRFGCQLTFAGVMLAKSVNNPKVIAKQEFRPYPDEQFVGGQVLGRDPEVMAKSLVALRNAGYDLVDLNFACPSPKVLRRGRGGALLKEPELAIEILKRCRDAVDCPLLIKLRIGWGKGAENREKFWQIVEAATDNGIDALVIHGRTVMERYRGQSDWRMLGEVKKRYPLMTVVGSGDVFDAAEAVGIMQKTGIDGVIAARGAIGNPWIFRELAAVVNGKDVPLAPDLSEQAQTMLSHFDLVRSIYEPGKAVRYFRKFSANYCRRHPERKKAQMEIMAANDEKQFFDAVKKWYSAA